MSDSVWVVCTEASHEGKVVKVAQFLRNQGSVVQWHEWGASTLKASRAAEYARAREPGVIGLMRHLPPRTNPKGHKSSTEANQWREERSPKPVPFTHRTPTSSTHSNAPSAG